MRIRSLLIIGLAVLLAVGFLFVACNNEVTTDTAEIKITPSVSKALNQSGKNSDLSTDVNDFHWQIYCSTLEPNLNSTDTLDWQEFSDNPATGLGVVSNLTRGSHLYFGLRGFTTGTNSQLVWEGFHKDSATGAVESILLSHKTQVVTVDVYNKGTGSLYFNISAPMVYSDDKTSNTDRFVYSYYKLGNSANKTNGFMQSKYDAENEAFYFANEAGTPEANLEAGEYLFTIKQQTWNIDTNAYEDISFRKQVIIVSIQSGIDTVITGSLDSYSTTGMTKIDYEGHGYTKKNQQHIRVDFVDGDPSSITEFKATVYDEKGLKQVSASKGSHIAEGKDGNYLRINWTSTTNIQLYVNGELIKTSGSDWVTTDEGFLERIDDLQTKIKTSGKNSLLALVSKADTYMVTLVHRENGESKSVSFTVCHAEDPLGFTSSDYFAVNAFNQTKTWDGSLYYNNGNGWTEWDGKVIKATKVGDTYQLKIRGVGNTVITGVGNTYRGIDSSGFETKGWTLFTYKQPVKISGNISALFDYQKDPNKIVMGDFALAGIFKATGGTENNSWEWLVEAPEFNLKKITKGCYAESFRNCIRLTTPTSLPCTEIAASCYDLMYYGCTALKTTVPELPATVLYPYCYAGMFWGCKNIEDAPELKALEMKDHCYAFMFSTCSKLKAAPTLPATKVDQYCYLQMFGGCTSITEAPDLPAKELARCCYQTMFAGCPFVDAPVISATKLAYGCYLGMFKDCPNIVVPTDYLPITTLENFCYGSMFEGSGIKVAPALPAAVLPYDCYGSMFSLCPSLTTLTNYEGTDCYIPDSVTYTDQSYHQWCGQIGRMFASCYNLTFAAANTTTTDLQLKEEGYQKLIKIPEGTNVNIVAQEMFGREPSVWNSVVSTLEYRDEPTDAQKTAYENWSGKTQTPIPGYTYYYKVK